MSQLKTSNQDDSSVPEWQKFIQGIKDDYVPIIGIGSLLSERSSRLTFPNLINFRMARMKGYRRIFCHPAAVFHKRGIQKVETKELSSLSAEKLGEKDFNAHPQLRDQQIIVTTFEIPKNEVPAFIEREEEFSFDVVTVQDIIDDESISKSSTGLLCTRSTDSEYIRKLGQTRFDEDCKAVGLTSIWDSPGEIYPCRLYLRHCLLAAKKLSSEVYDNFLDTTYLYDRKTKLRKYVEEKYDLIMNEKPNKDLGDRYDG